MAKKFLVDLNLLKNEIQNGVFQHLAGHPENPKEGQFYYNTVEKKFYVFEGEAWACFDSASAMLEKLEKKADKAYTGTLVDGGVATELASALDETTKAVNANKASLDTLNGGAEVAGSVANSVKTAIEGLNSEKAQEAGADGLALSIKLEDGKVTELTGSIAADTYDAHGAAKAVQGETTATVKEVEDAVAVLNGDKTAAGSVAKSISDALGEVTSENYVTKAAQVNANISTLDAKIKSLEDVSTGTTVVVDAEKGEATVTKGDATFTTYTKDKGDELLAGKADKATTLAGYGIEDAYTKDEINGKIASVYKPAGSIAFADLPILAANVLGNVYNITDAFITTADFIEGEGKKHPAGTNVVVVNTGTNEAPVYKFDVLAGFVDLSAYATKVEMKAADDKLAEDIAAGVAEVKAEIRACRTIMANPELTPVAGIVTWEVTHTYGEDVEVAIKEAATGEEVVANVLQANNLVTIKFNASETVAAGTYRAVVIGFPVNNAANESGK